MKDLKDSNDCKNHVGGLSQLTWKKFTRVPTTVGWVYGQLSSPAFRFPLLHMTILRLEMKPGKTIKNRADRLSCPDHPTYVLYHLRLLPLWSF